MSDYLFTIQFQKMKCFMENHVKKFVPGISMTITIRTYK